MGDNIVPSLINTQVLVEKNLPIYMLELFEKLFECEVGEWLKSTMEIKEVVVVRQIGRDEHDKAVDNCVTIDTVKEHVLDPCEVFPLFARAGVLGHCVGDGVRLERIEEVSNLVRQPMRGERSRRQGIHTKRKGI